MAHLFPAGTKLFTTKTLLAASAVLFTLPAALPAVEMLRNGDFEQVLETTDGNHIGTVPTDWTVGGTATPFTPDASLSNLVRGTVTTGTGVSSPSQYLAVDSAGDPGGDQSLDGVGTDVIAFQQFTLADAYTGAVTANADFGGRDSTSGKGAGSTWELLSPSGAVVAQSPMAVTPATGTWVPSFYSGNLTLLPGTYTFEVSLADPDQVDAASVNLVDAVPEPSTKALVAGLMLAGGAGMTLRRRQRTA